MSGATPVCPEPSCGQALFVSPAAFADHLLEEHDMPALGIGKSKGTSSEAAALESAVRWNGEIDALTELTAEQRKPSLGAMQSANPAISTLGAASGGCRSHGGKN